MRTDYVTERRVQAGSRVLSCTHRREKLPFIETERLPTKCGLYEWEWPRQGQPWTLVEAFSTLVVSCLLCEIRSKCVGAGNEEGEEDLVWRRKAGESSRSVSLGEVTGMPNDTRGSLGQPSVLPTPDSSDQARELCASEEGIVSCFGHVGWRMVVTLDEVCNPFSVEGGSVAGCPWQDSAGISLNVLYIN